MGACRSEGGNSVAGGIQLRWCCDSHIVAESAYAGTVRHVRWWPSVPRWSGFVRVRGAEHMTSQRPTPDTLKDGLLALEEDIESRSEALPPGDDTLDGWKTRLDVLWEEVRGLRRDARNRLWTIVQRIGGRIDTLRDATVTFRSASASFDNIDSAAPGAGRTALASAISGALAAQPSADAPMTVPVARADRAARRSRVVAPVPSLDAGTAAAREEPARKPLQSRESRRARRHVSPDSPPVSVPPKKRIPDPVPAIVRHAPVVVAGAPSRIAPLPAARAQRTDPIVAYVGRLARRGSFEAACGLACDWLRSRWFKLPDDVSADFECQGPGDDRAIVVRYAGIWALQADTFDRAAGRRWRLEMVLLEDASSAPALSLVLQAIGPAELAPPAPSVPRLASNLIDQIGLVDLRDGAVLSTSPEWVDSESDVDALVSRLRSRTRQHPVIVLSQYWKGGANKTLLDPGKLAEKLRGLAHVVVLKRDNQASWALTDRLSKRFSVFGASLRLYRPGFTTEDDPELHPLWTPTALRERNVQLAALQAELLRVAAQLSLTALASGDGVPAFDDVQKAVLRQRIAKARAKQTVALDTVSLRGRVSELERALEEANELAGMFSRDKDELKDQLERVTEDRDKANAKVAHLSDRVKMLEQEKGAASGARVELPNAWDGLEAWADQYLGRRVIVTPKAARAARRSAFENVPFAYEVLLFLANIYVPFRRGELGGGKELLESEEARLGVDVSGVGTAAKTHRWRDTYSTPYKSGQVPLDMHVSGKSDRDARYGFRLYFYWDPEDMCAVVGSFPSHLDNSLS